MQNQVYNFLQTGARLEHKEIILYGFINEKTFRDRGSGLMTLEIIIILLTIILAVYFLFRPTSKKEKERFEDKDNWRGGF